MIKYEKLILSPLGEGERAMSGIVVTGSAGFIGSHLCERLLEEDFQVIGIDNFDSYYDRWFKERNLAALRDRKQFRFIEADIRDLDGLRREIGEAKVMIHLAARPGVRPSMKNPELYADINISGTISVLELALKLDVDQFIFGSSSSVYGLDEIPFREDSPADRPLSVYGGTKRASEIILHAYSYNYGLPVTILRFFTVYGPRVRPDMAIYKFARGIFLGEEITVYGEGRLKRDYTYISDIVDGIMKALKRKFNYEILNLGSGRPIEIIKLIRLLEKYFGRKAKLRFAEKPREDMPETYADISKAKKLLGYEPKVPIEEGVRKFVEWFLSSMKELHKPF